MLLFNILFVTIDILVPCAMSSLCTRITVALCKYNQSPFATGVCVNTCPAGSMLQQNVGKGSISLFS